MRLGCRWPHQLNCAEVLVLTGHGRGRSSPQVRRRSGQFSGSTGGKRRPDPHGRIIAAEFLDQFWVDADDAVAALTLDSLEGTPRRLLVGSKGRPGVTIAVHGILLSRNQRQDRSEHSRQVPADISRHSTELDKQQFPHDTRHARR